MDNTSRLQSFSPLIFQDLEREVVISVGFVVYRLMKNCFYFLSWSHIVSSLFLNTCVFESYRCLSYFPLWTGGGGVESRSESTLDPSWKRTTPFPFVLLRSSRGSYRICGYQEWRPQGTSGVSVIRVDSLDGPCVKHTRPLFLIWT